MFSLLTLLAALRLPAKPSAWHFVVLGLLTALTILFHIVGGLVGLIVIVMLLWDDAPERLSVRITSRRLRELAVYFGTTAVCVMIPYVLVITQVRHLRTSSEAFYFVAQFAQSGAFVTTGSRGVLTAIQLALSGSDGLMWGSLVIASGGFGWTDYTRYYLSTPTLMLDTVFVSGDYPTAQRVIENAIEAVREQGGRVFVTEDALEPELCRAEQFGWDLSLFEHFREDISPRLDCFESDGISICEVVN